MAAESSVLLEIVEPDDLFFIGHRLKAKKIKKERMKGRKICNSDLTVPALDQYINAT